jgi:hypothetical protein
MERKESVWVLKITLSKKDAAKQIVVHAIEVV